MTFESPPRTHLRRALRFIGGTVLLISAAFNYTSCTENILQNYKPRQSTSQSRRKEEPPIQRSVEHVIIANDGTGRVSYNTSLSGGTDDPIIEIPSGDKDYRLFVPDPLPQSQPSSQSTTNPPQKP